jgi:hypothetical protein
MINFRLINYEISSDIIIYVGENFLILRVGNKRRDIDENGYY